MIEYPSHCIRGLRKGDHIIKDDKGITHVNYLAFMPDDRTSEKRKDKGAETSINWEDDSTVLSFTLNNNQHAAFGAARLSRERLDSIIIGAEIMKKSDIKHLAYERHPLPDNPFHGNLVYIELLNGVVRMIAGIMAMYAEHHEK